MKTLKFKKRFVGLLLCVVIMFAFIPGTTNAQQLASEVLLGTTNIDNSYEIVTLREENIKHYDMGNGTFQAVAYSHPIHEQDGDGNWKEIDFSLKLTGTRSSRLYTSKVAGAAFAENYIASQPIMTLSNQDNAISSFLLTTGVGGASGRTANTTVAAEVTNPQNSFKTIGDAKRADFSSKIQYKDVLPGVDLMYVVDPGTVEGNIIINQKASSYRYTFALNLTGMYPVLQDDGSIIVYNEDTGGMEYEIPAPFMYDTLGNVSEEVSYTLTKNNGTYTLNITADADWINTKGRSTPVILVHTYVVSTESVDDTYIDSDNPDVARGSRSTLWVRSNRITYIKTPTPSVPYYAELEWAELTAFYYYFDYVNSGSVGVTAHRVNGGSWNENTLTWNSIANVQNYGLVSSALDGGVTYGSVGATVSNPAQIDFTVTGAVQGWLNGTYPNYGIGLKYVEGSSNLSVVFKSSESSYNYRPRITYSYSVNSGAYFSALQNIYGFTPEEATLIMKLYSRVYEKFPNKSIYETAWISSRVIGGIVYGKESEFDAFQWNSTAGTVFEGDEESYFINTLGFTSTEYNNLKNYIVEQCRNSRENGLGDFVHMQISIAARLAYYLDLDGCASNYAGSDETVSYLAGWLGDATLPNNEGLTVLKNDDYIADLDAENIYRQILQGKSITTAADSYFESLTTSNRAQIFTSYIPFETVKTMVYYELVDKDLYAIAQQYELAGDAATAARYYMLINDEAYHQDFISSAYPDTHDFIYSIYNLRHTIGDY